MTSSSSIAAAAGSRHSRTGCSPVVTDWPSWPGPTGASSGTSPETPRGRVRVRDLLTRAAERYDAPRSPLRAAAAGAALGGFASGAVDAVGPGNPARPAVPSDGVQLPATRA